MGTEFQYSLDTYPFLYALWGLVGASWMLAAVGFVARLARARPVTRFDRPAARIAAALRDSAVQRPIWRRRLAGAMHLTIMLGALLVLVTFLITHYVAPRGPEWNRSRLAHALVDAAILLLLAGLAAAAWRRHARRELPARAEDVALWALLVVGTLAALLSESLLVGLALPAWRRSAFLSAPLAGALGALSEPLRRSLYGWSWSVLHAALLGAALLLPWTKWRHIVLAPFALLTRKAEPLARLDSIDLEADGPFGALRPSDLTWKERLDLAACTHCGRCTQACPAVIAGDVAAGGGSLDPRRLIESLADAAAAGPLAEACGEDVLWQCSTCMACDDACPVGISPLSLVVDLRRERVLDAARFPPALRDLFEHLARRGNPWGLPPSEHDDWLAVRGGALPLLPPGGETDVLLWLGCMGAYDSRAREAVLALAGVLREAGVASATLGPEEGCCGDPARRAGNEPLWRDLARRNLAALETRRFRQIVTLCPHCANALGNEYAPLGARLPVIHALPYLAGLLREGRLSLSAAPTGNGDDITAGTQLLRVAYHDPCYLARGMGDTTSARALLNALPGVQCVELPRRGRDTLCCGAGGGRMWLEGHDEARLGDARLEEIAAVGVDLCVTACPYCRTMIADGTGRLDGAAVPEVQDLVELIAHMGPPNMTPASAEARVQE